MSSKVQLRATARPMNGKEISFEEHDTFLFGRLNECHCCLPDDQQVSRRALHESYGRYSICAAG
jgi:hypothetical protein